MPRAGKLVHTIRTRGIGRIWRFLMRKSGTRVESFYWVRELLPEQIPEQYRVLPEGYSFTRLGEEDFEMVVRLQNEDEHASVEEMHARARQGHTCLGVTRGDQLIAYTWFALDRSQTVLYPRKMLANEAYLFNAYVLPAERGRNLAVIMRYQCYQRLRELGRDTLYSVTVRANKASWRFKEKLGAEKIFFAVYFSLFHKLESCWILRRYPLSRT